MAVLFEVLTRHPSGDVQWAVGLTQLELSDDVRSEDINFGVTYI